MKIGGFIVISIREKIFEELGHLKYLENLVTQNYLKEIKKLKFKKYEGMSGEKSIGFFYEDDGCILAFQKLQDYTCDIWFLIIP